MLLQWRAEAVCHCVVLLTVVSGVGDHFSYSPQSSEFKLRRMGDLLFMIGDFESAYNCYRTVASDFKDGRAHKYFAGANEFAALCCWLSDGSRKDIESYFDTAFKVIDNPPASHACAASCHCVIEMIWGLIPGALLVRNIRNSMLEV